MTAPFYVSPEQWLADKAEYARKGIARGRPIVALEHESGVVMMAENHSASLRKIHEVYDRIAFGGVGKLDEYENLRKAGVRWADTQGYSYSREDVSGKSLANLYSTALGAVFTREPKALEVEILIVEVHADDSIFYQIRFDGSMIDREHYAAIGGDDETLIGLLQDGWREGLSIEEAVRLGRKTLIDVNGGEDDGALDAQGLEVGLLERARDGRCFRRLGASEIAQWIG
ncbi:MAG: proteasome subunit alpha [Proteobacteria bacterium]|nr:proteasome subunit alpha [Pseudomonadota bacterium]